MGKPGATGLTRIIRATGYSMAGFRYAWRNEAAFRQETVLCLVLLPLAFRLGETGTEKALLAASVLIVLVAELLNSALEALVDLTSPEHHPLAGAAKDMGSAAVFVSLALTALVWACILIA